MRFSILLVLFIVIESVQFSFGQITDGNVKPEKEPKTKKEKAEKSDSSFSEDSLNGTNFYITGLALYSYRKFEDESFNNYYKTWEDQTPAYKGGINLGFIMELNKYVHVDLGISYFGHGENYFYEDSLTDSTYQYQRTYRQVAIPIHFRLVYGEKIQGFAFAGIAPLNILKTKYTSTYTFSNGVEQKPEDVISGEGFSTFNAMITAGLGMQYNVKHFGFTINAEYRNYLANTYADKIIALNHKMWGIGINAGIVLRF